MTQTINELYEGRDPYKREYRHVLFNNHYLQVVTKQGKKLRDVTVDLHMMHATPQREDNNGLQWLLAMVILILLAVGMVAYVIYDFSMDNLIVGAIGVVICALLSYVFFYLSRSTSYHRASFKTRFADFPLITIHQIGKDAEGFEAFIEKIHNAVVQTQSKKKYDDEQLKAGEVRMLRRYFDNGVLSEHEYETAKQHIFTLQKTG